VHDHSRATPATVTISSNVSLADVEAFLSDPRALARCFGDELSDKPADFGISTKPAPGGRGTELHASSHEKSKSDLKHGLARMRALLEAGEIPTGARR
jgi:hypothetical protein